MNFGNNIINRTITNIADSLVQTVNDSFDSKMSVYFPLGIISGYSFPFFFGGNAKPIMAKAIDPALSAIDAGEKIIAAHHWFPETVQTLNAHGISVHGLLAGGAAIAFFDDQFLCGSLIGLGLSVYKPFPEVAVSLITIGAISEFYIIN